MPTVRARRVCAVFSQVFLMGSTCTLICLSFETPKTIKLPFVPNEKLMAFRCFNI